MESPVIVTAPGFRVALAAILAYWSDRDIQRREWIRHDRVEPFWDSLYYQLGDIQSYIDSPPPVLDSIGSVVATRAEAQRAQNLLDSLDELLDADGVDLDDGTTFIDRPLWHRINGLSQSALNLIVMNGGSWGPDSVSDAEAATPSVVSQYPRRALAAQCLASLADDGASDLTEQPPLRRDFGDATATLVDRCALSDPTAAIGFIYRNGDEIPRLKQLYDAIQREAPKGEIATLAGHALTAVVRAWAGWNYDGPIDATRSSR